MKPRRVLGIATWLAGVAVPGIGLPAAESLDPRLVDRAITGQSAALETRATAETRATVTLDRWRTDRALTAGDIQVTDLEGRDLSAETEKRVENGRVELALPEDRRDVIVRLREVVSLPLPERRTTLPGGVVQSGPDAGDESAWFRPSIMATPVPVTWNTEQRRYSTRIFLGLQPPRNAPAAQLDQPIVMRLGFRGLTAEPVPDVTLAMAGVEHEKEVELSFLPTTEAPVIEVRSSLGDVDLTMEVLPRLELRPVGDSVPGLGLGAVAVDVVRLHPHGAPAAVAEDTDVTVEIQGGAHPEEERVQIPAGQSRTRFTLRSARLGPVTIKATAGALSDSRTIDQQLPVAPLTAALVGGALGGFSRRFRKGSAAVADGARVVEGLLVALVAYAASVVGVGWLGIPAAVAGTAAGAFLVGVLAGFVGVTVIEVLAKKGGAAPT